MKEPVCTTSSRAAGEPTSPSAPDAAAWLCLEQSGPWGAKAWTSSHLDADLGARLESAANGAGVRPSLIRTPGPHADHGHEGHRAVLVASTHPERSWLLAGHVDDPARLLDLDLRAAAVGDLEAVHRSLPALAPTTVPVLLVCTNGTRDTCCARLGRPVAVAAARANPGRVWEVTHTSGHRFAPTTVLLPSGHLHGRVLDAARILAAADSGRLDPAGWRGRSTWPAAGQAAEERVRALTGATGLDDLVVRPEGDRWLVTHRDGRRWLAEVATHTDGERAESCGKDLKPVTWYDVRLEGAVFSEA